MGETINADNAKSILKDVVKEDNQGVLPEKIRSEVAKYYGIRKGDMDSKKRSADIAFPRMVAMYLIRKNTDISLPDIGKLFGGRHHATVIHSIEKIDTEMSENRQVKEAVEKIMKKVNSR